MENGDLVIKWGNLPPAPGNFLAEMRCSCKKSHCATRQCECLKNMMACTDMCKCERCENQIDENIELNKDHEEDTEDSDFE